MGDLVQSVKVIPHILGHGSRARKACVVRIALPEKTLLVLNAAESLPPVDVTVWKVPGQNKGDGLLFAGFHLYGSRERAVDRSALRGRRGHASRYERSIAGKVVPESRQ